MHPGDRILVKAQFRANFLPSAALPWVTFRHHLPLLYSQNPAVRQFIGDTPLEDVPDEICVIRINSQRRDGEPLHRDKNHIHFFMPSSWSFLLFDIGLGVLAPCLETRTGFVFLI